MGINQARSSYAVSVATARPGDARLNEYVGAVFNIGNGNSNAGPSRIVLLTLKARAALRHVFRLDNVLPVLSRSNASVDGQRDSRIVPLILGMLGGLPLRLRAHGVNGDGGHLSL